MSTCDVNRCTRRRLDINYGCESQTIRMPLYTYLLTTLLQTSYPQLVLFGDSLLQGSIDVQGGFSFQAALEARMSTIGHSMSHSI